MTRRTNRQTTRRLWNIIPRKYRIIAAIVIIGIIACNRYCSESSTAPHCQESYNTSETASSTTTGSLAYGPGSELLLDVRHSSKQAAEYPSEMLRYAGMNVSFNSDWHTPNWVAWELLASEVGGEHGRSNRFVADPGVAASANTDDYRNSGFDRGHMAPAGDMKWSREAMDETFYMTNICPQVKSLNTGPWKKLEEKCRQWALRDSAIVVICGPIIADGFEKRIGATGVAVPKKFFKVVLAPYLPTPKGIGFIMENSASNPGMQQTAVSIDSVEAATGLDFFHALPDEIEDIVEAQCDFNSFSNKR